MKELPLHALRAFASVHQHGGVRAASRALGVAHSSVSRHLAELEKWLGTELIVRVVGGAGRGGLTFSAQGEALGRALRESLTAIEHAVDAARESRSPRSVAIAARPSFALRWLLPRLPDFEHAFPEVEVSVLVEERAGDPDGSAIDLAIRMGAAAPASGDEALMDDALYPVMSFDFWNKAGRPARPDALVGLRLLHDRDPQASWEAWRRVHGPATLDIRKGPRFTSSDAVLRAAALGQGVALARHRLAAADVAASTLCRPLGALSVAVGPSYWLVLPRQVGLRPAVVKLVGWLRRQAAADPGSPLN